MTKFFKILLLAIFALGGVLQSNAEEGNPAIEVTFSDTEKSAGWWADVENVEEGGVTYKASAELENGNYCVQLKRINANSWRGDLKFDSSKGKPITLNKDVDKYLAIKFIGERPASNTTFKFEVNIDGEWYYVDGNNTKNPAYQQEKVSTGGNHVYIINLYGLYTRVNDQKNNEQYSGGTVSKLNFIFADAKEQVGYVVDWIRTYSDVNDIDADWKDDGDNDYVEYSAYSVLNETTKTGYNSLTEAVNAAQSDDEIVILKDVELSGRIDTGGRNLLIKGATENVKITRSSSYNGLMFLTTNDDGAALSVKNLTIDGGSVEVATSVFESSNGKNLNIENVTIQNVNSTQNYGAAICNMNSGILVLDNVTFKNCICNGNSTPSVLFVGTNTVTLKNNVSFENCGDVPNVRIENYYSLNADNLQNTTPITLGLGNHSSSDSGSTVVKNCSNNKKFALYHSYDFLQVVNVDLVLKQYKLVNTTKTPMLGYNNLTDAITNALDEETIEIRYDVTTPNNRIDVKKSIVLKGVNGAVVKNGTSDNNMILLSQTATGVTLEDIIIDGQGKNRNDIATLEAGSGFKLILKNVEIRNLISGRDVTVNGSLDLFGNNILPNGVRLNSYKRIDDHETTHTNPIRFTLAHDYSSGGLIVKGCSDVSKYVACKVIDSNKYEWEVYANGEDLRARQCENYNLEISGAGVATLVLPFDAEIPEGLTAYTITYTGGNTASASKVEGTIEKNTPVYVKGTPGTYTLTKNTSSVEYVADPVHGALIGTYEYKTFVPAGSYFLSAKKNGNEYSNVGFYRVSSDNTKYVGAFRAYMKVEQGARETIFVDFDNTTGVEAIGQNGEFVRDGKFVIGGKLIILKDGRKYNVAGQIVK